MVQLHKLSAARPNCRLGHLWIPKNDGKSKKDFKEKWRKNDLPEKCLMCGYRSLLVQVPKKIRAVAAAEKDGAWQWMSWAESCAAPFRWTSCPGDPQVDQGKTKKKDWNIS